MRLKTYSELQALLFFEERYEYLRIGGRIGVSTFGHSRFINQAFYTSRIWRSTRDEVIIRDNGCDLGIRDREIFGRVMIHHMNPITEDDIDELSDLVLNPEFLICTARNTHNAIHFGDASLLPRLPVARTPHDTSPWR